MGKDRPVTDYIYVYVCIYEYIIIMRVYMSILLLNVCIDLVCTDVV